MKFESGLESIPSMESFEEKSKFLRICLALAMAGSAAGFAHAEDFPAPIVMTSTENIIKTQANTQRILVTGGHTDDAMNGAFLYLHGNNYPGSNAGNLHIGTVNTGSFFIYSNNVIRYLISGDGAHAVTGPVTMSSTLGVSGLITATDGIEINGGNFAAGKIYHSLSDGLSIGAKTGSNYNFTLANNTGSAYLLRNPTGTNTMEFPNAVSMGSTLGIDGTLTAKNGVSIGNNFSSLQTTGTPLIYGSNGGFGSAGDLAIAARTNADNDILFISRVGAASVQAGRVQGGHGALEWSYPVNLLSNLTVGNNGLQGTSRLNVKAVPGDGIAVFNPAATYPGAQVGMIGFSQSAGFTDGLRAGMKAHVSENGTGGNAGMHLDFYTAAPNAGDGQQRMRIAADGLVTVSSNMSVIGDLTVGTVKARNWEVSEAPDYVFEKGYKLASLEKVESFVKRNKHLPEVPSAMELQKEGLDLVKMNFILLKKVEELTLHAIRQEKEMKRQSEEIRRLEGRVH